ncbi:MAG: macro domain-containing protein [Chloroflexi bacterium]|nr:macro domain-containing protein [Chloroflexota bacterium]
MNEILLEEIFLKDKIFQIVQGDITKEKVDAIVNAANSRLQHSGGVAWTISRKGGDIIQHESQKWVRQHGEVSHAQPAHTAAGKLPCKYVIHAVGPVWGDGDEDKKLADAITGSLRVASDLGLASVSLPAISTGIFGFPKERAARIIFSSIENYLSKNEDSPLKKVRLILYGKADAELYLVFWREYKK